MQEDCLTLSSQSRYILGHPDQCQNMRLNREDRHSGRHKMIDWSTLHESKPDSKHPITNAMVHEVVLQAGDVLYLPAYWFHFTVSLSTDYQCSARSGVTFKHDQSMIDCGFDVEDH